jgi:hypothetical protein
MSEQHTQPICPHCEVLEGLLGVWTDDTHLSAIFFCPYCGKAFAAQLLRPRALEEGRDA